jgi:hypothetical protein
MNGITRSRVGLMGTLVLAAGMAALALAAPVQGALRSTVAHPHNWIGVPYVVSAAPYWAFEHYIWFPFLLRR